MHAKDKKEIFNYENNLNELPQILSKFAKDNGKFQVLSQISNYFL